MCIIEFRGPNGPVKCFKPPKHQNSGKLLPSCLFPSPLIRYLREKFLTPAYSTNYQLLQSTSALIGEAPPSKNRGDLAVLSTRDVVGRVSRVRAVLVGVKISLLIAFLAHFLCPCGFDGAQIFDRKCKFLPISPKNFQNFSQYYKKSKKIEKIFPKCLKMVENGQKW